MRAYFLLSAQNMSERICKKLESPVACGNGNSCLNNREGRRPYSVVC